MPITPAKRTPESRGNQFAGEYPIELPHFSEDALKRVPHLNEWQSRMDRWYYDFRTVLLRNLTDLDGALNILDLKEATESTAASQGTDIASILSRLGDLTIDVGLLKTRDAALQSEINGILSQLASLQGTVAGLAKRLAALEYLVSIQGDSPSALALSKKILDTDFMVPNYRSAIISDYLDILPGVTLDIGVGATVEIT